MASKISSLFLDFEYSVNYILTHFQIIFLFSVVVPTATPSSSSTTQLLMSLQDGASDASEKLLSQIYDKLRRLARVVRNGKAPFTLNTTALVHEAYLHLRPDEGIDVESRKHFFRLAARAMRQVIAHEVRHRSAQKRGGNAVTVPFDERFVGTRTPMADLLSLEDALQALGRMKPRQVRVVECRFYAGLSVKETAQVLDISPTTVKRDWRAARAWLVAYLNDG